VIIEQLTFTVPHELLDHWLAADAALWDAMLAAQPGYLGKEVWITEPHDDTAGTVEVQVIVRWTDRAQWKAVDPELLSATHAAMGEYALASRETVHITRDDLQPGRGGSGGASA
jgi:uncharacterized protein (TIGR03792 family)